MILVWSHSTLPSVVDPLCISRLSCSQCLDFISASVVAASTWKRADHFRCDGMRHITSQLLFFPVVFGHESSARLFINILPAQPAYFEHDPKEYFLWATGPVKTLLSWASDVASGNIGSAIDGKGNTVGDLFTPAYYIQSAKFPHILTAWTYLLRKAWAGPKLLRKHQRVSISSCARCILRSRRDLRCSTPI